MSAFKKSRGGGSGGGKGGGPCFAFQRGECDRGDTCKFAHVMEDRDASRKTNLNAAGAAASNEVCRQFQLGKCRRGTDCRFSHEGDTAVVSAVPAVAAAARAPKAGKTARPAAGAEGSLVAAAGAMESAPSHLGTVATAGHITESRFDALNISEQSRRALAQTFKYEYMSAVQSQTLPILLQGTDCLAKAKTGTGKTLAFLIPTVENIVKTRSTGGMRNEDIFALVLSPTRELAAQIASEADILLTFQTGYKVVTVVGGTNINRDKTNMQGRVDILVATPGRLLDHLQQGVSNRMRNLKVLIFDEADQLLDMGFRPDVERILSLLPSKGSRQTLLFSATVPKAVQEIARTALRPGYGFIDTVGEEQEQTHAHVQQELIVCEDRDQALTMADILQKEVAASNAAGRNYKIIVFFTTARVTQYYAQFFNTFPRDFLGGTNVLEIHSRKSQSARTSTSNQFRDARNAIMFSSDVSARGLDYPDVSFVMQCGLTDREQYIHRLGRTARAGKSGHGALMIAPYEERYMQRNLKGLPVKPLSSVPTAQTVAVVQRALGGVEHNTTLKTSAQMAYGAWLGYYNSNLSKCGWDKAHLVQMANMFASYLGLTNQPVLQKKTVGKMGLKGVPGLMTE